MTDSMVILSCVDAAAPATAFLEITRAARKEAADILEKKRTHILEGLLVVLVLGNKPTDHKTNTTTK